jgi:hypothetical protein
MNIKKGLFALLLSAVCVTPAIGNSFSNPHMSTMLNVGSAPSPTPLQLRDIGDSHGVFKSAELLAMDAAELRAMDGKDVYGLNREYLGFILEVSLGENLAEVQLLTGVAVAVTGERLVDLGDRVIAPTISFGDILAMAREQNNGELVAAGP